jgi:hypothetical protein
MGDSLYINPRTEAEQAFDRARHKAFLENVVSHLRGQPTDLLSFDAVRGILGLNTRRDLGLQQIPIDRIVGSVGKYQEFSRSFLPRLAQDRERWKGVFATALDSRGLPPIEVYQVGEVYFVIDGNHRVSVARQLGATTMEAYVTKLTTPMTVTPDTDLPTLILQAEKAQFLQHTRLAELRPEAKIEATCPGAYKQLEDIIVARGCTYCMDQKCEIDWDEAVTRWYDDGYCPLIEFIRASNILSQFPGNTETDLYLWIMEHRDQLSSSPEMEEEMDKLLEHLAIDHNPGRLRNVIRGWLSHPFRKSD